MSSREAVCEMPLFRAEAIDFRLKRKYNNI